MPLPFATLTFDLIPQPNSYALRLHFVAAQSEGENLFGPWPCQLDLTALLSQTDPQAYGRLLTAQLLADPTARARCCTLLDGVNLTHTPLRLSFALPVTDATLHQIHWETLCHPTTHTWLATQANVWCVRLPYSDNLRPVQLRPKAELTTTLAVANPEGLAQLRLAPVPVAAELARARAALAGWALSTLPDAAQTQRVTLDNVLAALRAGADVLYLVCHGRLVDADPKLMLEDAAGQLVIASGIELAQRVGELDPLPRLVVLASCQSAEASAGQALAALGPRLAAVGVPAVLAMLGQVSMTTVEQFMPVFFAELAEDGQIDRALAVARGAVQTQADWWMPVLFLRAGSGQLWLEPTPAAQGGGNIFSGPVQQVIIAGTPTAADEAQEQADLDAKKLARVMAQLTQSLHAKAQTPPPTVGNPYQYFDPYKLDDATCFFGRDAETAHLCEQLLSAAGQLVVLYGDARVGKTSLLQAGVAPALLARQHLPVLISVTPDSPLATQIKQKLLPDLNTAPGLSALPLNEFLRRISAYLPAGNHVFILLDQFETIFALPTEQRQAFVQAFARELASCLADDRLNSHWLISVRAAAFGNLDELHQAQTQVQPFNNKLRLNALTRVGAQAALVQSAQLRQLTLEEPLVEAILNDLGGDPIDPSQLQVVAHALAESLPLAQKQLTLAAYQQAGRASGILHAYFDEVLARHVPPACRAAAWQTLSILADTTHPQWTSADLLAQLETYAIAKPQGAEVLRQLDVGRLIRLVGEHYALASESIVPRIQQWRLEQAVAQKVRAETQRQMEQIRGSALRGLLGGALGFILAFLVVYPYTAGTALQLVLYTAANRALPGAFAGFLTVLSTDIALTYTGPRPWWRWLIAGLPSALAFALAVLFHATLRSSSMLTQAALEGATWGLVIGLGTLGIMRTQHRWQTLAGIGVTSVLGGLVLWLADQIGHAFTLTETNFSTPPIGGAPLTVILAGAVVPLCILVAALWARKN